MKVFPISSHKQIKKIGARQRGGMVDTRDLKSLALYVHASSILAAGMDIKKKPNRRRFHEKNFIVARFY